MKKKHKPELLYIDDNKADLIYFSEVFYDDYEVFCASDRFDKKLKLNNI